MSDHQANGLMENAVKNAVKTVQGQFRVWKVALECRVGRRIDEEHLVVPWLAMYAASVINRGRMDQEGFAALRRWNSRELNKPAAEFSECVPDGPAGWRNKFDARWVDGVWLGWLGKKEWRVDRRNTRGSRGGERLS